jgi:hypothetical protein
VFVPEVAHGSRAFERSRGNRLADDFESVIGLPGVLQYAISTNEFDASLLLRPFDAGNEDWTDFARHPHMRAAAGRTIKPGDVDHANVADTFRWLA